MGGPKIWDLGVFVQLPPDAMTYKISHHGKPMFLHPRLDGIGDVKKAIPSLCLFNPNVKGLLRYLEKSLGFPVDLTHRKGDGRIPEITVKLGSYIEAYNISLLQSPLAGNAVDHLFVDRNTDRSGKTPITFKCGGGSSRKDDLFGDLIQLLGGDPGHNYLPQFLKDLRHNDIGFPQLLNLARRPDDDHRISMHLKSRIVNIERSFLGDEIVAISEENQIAGSVWHNTHVVARYTFLGSLPVCRQTGNDSTRGI